METLKCNQIVNKEAIYGDPGLLDYIIDQLASDVGKKVLDRLLTNGISICRADTKMYQLLDINAVNIIDTVKITKLIMCKDCKNWDTDWLPSDGVGHYCSMIDLVTTEDFYCSEAERKYNG